MKGQLTIDDLLSNINRKKQEKSNNDKKIPTPTQIISLESS
jgi:hypothetical protein